VADGQDLDQPDRDIVTTTHDGRRRRSEATRERIVAAMKALIEEGVLAPTAEMIAARAGVSSRSVFFRFGDTAELYLAVIDSVFAETLPLLPPMATEGSTVDRTRLFVDRRAKSGEQFRHFWRAGNVLFAQNPTIGARGETIRAIARTRIETAFAPEIAALGMDAAKSLVDAIATVSDWEVWDLMRRYQSRSVEEAKATLEILVSGALALHGFVLPGKAQSSAAPNLSGTARRNLGT